MWRLALRDLLWRRRRFAIAVAATGLVFAITLLLAGLSASLNDEPVRTVRAVGADAWVVRSGTSGPYTATNLLPADSVGAVAAAPGVIDAEPFVIARAVVRVHEKEVDVNVVGIAAGGLGSPVIARGQPSTGNGLIVADSLLGVRVDDQIAIGAHEFRVVGTASNASFNFGTPTLFMTASDAQLVSFEGQPLVSAVLVKGHPDGLPEGLTALTPRQVSDDLHRPVEKGLKTISFVAVLLWFVAAGIVGSIVYLSALERTRDFAVLKATGTSNRALFISLAVQALVLAGTAAIVAAVLARVLEPQFPVPVTIGAGAYVGLGLLAAVVAVIASLAGLRRAVTVDPALAFGGG